jgi:hypothetical protein
VNKLRATLAGMPGVQFVDLCITTHPEPFTRPQLYRNLNHLNLAGAEILTALLAEEILSAVRSHLDDAHVLQALPNRGL